MNRPAADVHSAPASPGPRAGAATSGLSAGEAAARLRRDGPNLLPQADRRRWPAILIGVVREPMLLLLIGAAAVYWLLGDPHEAVVLGVSVLLVIALTVYQEQRSEHALQALRDLSSPRARVIRDGMQQVVSARELVVGDLIVVAEGDRIPADARVLDDTDLHVDESMLTGESVPVRRTAAVTGTVAQRDADDDTRLHASTLVVRGRGLAVVTATGSSTAVGRIGESLRGLHPQSTPMQRDMRRAVAWFALIGLASCVLVVLLYGATRGDWLHALLAGITLAISNIPEEFPVMLAVFMALGAWRMARHQALVRRAPAIETLGAVTVLCTDKTGTLTENRMRVAELAVDGRHETPGRALSPAMQTLLVCASLSSQDQPHDPMERALHEAVSGRPVAARARGWKRMREYPLSGELLANTHVWRWPDSTVLRVVCKGAPEAVAELCGLHGNTRGRLLAEVDAMARHGLRVIAVAEAEWHAGTAALPESPHGFEFAWRGLVGLIDPVRKGVPEAVADARAAGIRVLMLTGDHLQTARAIAASSGLDGHTGFALGRELDELDGAALQRKVRETDVFARVRPEHKLRLVQALRQDGAIVAMTGDGVNDAPALMAAHVGVAMGARGTDVAREAASIVLLDDNFVTVIRAIRQGRTIYDNLRRAVRFVLAVHVPITGLALLPLLLGDPMVLLPLHVVFLELVIDPACTIVFEQDPPATDVMRRPPRDPRRHLLDVPTLLLGLGQGALAFAAVALVYLFADLAALPAPQRGALAFVALVIGNLGLIVLNRSGGSLGRALLRRNRAFWAVATMALAVLAAIVAAEPVARWFHFAPPPPRALVPALLMPLLMVLLVDLARQRRHRRRPGR